MAIIITDECINCHACVAECPNLAIYEPSEDWRFSDGTELKGKISIRGEAVDANEPLAPLSDDVYYIATDKCTECIGFSGEPQCAYVCPVECCISDEDHVETEEQLLAKKKFLHNE